MWNRARSLALLFPLLGAGACSAAESSDTRESGAAAGQAGGASSSGSGGRQASGGALQAGASSASGGSKSSGKGGASARGGSSSQAGESASGGESELGGADNGPPSTGGAAAGASSTGSGFGGTSQNGSGGVSIGGGYDRFLFSPYKDVGINMNWRDTVISTAVSGTPTALAADLQAHGVGTVTLAFATGECGRESWAGADGALLAEVNAAKLREAGIRYWLSTGGAAGPFVCSSDEGFRNFLLRWSGDQLLGVDFDIEAGQSDAVIAQLIERIPAARAANPELLFSITLATLANNSGASVAEALGPEVADSLSTPGRVALAAVRDVLGWKTPATWPGYLTINLMVMDYGTAGSGVCVVRDGKCDMGQSAIQAAHNLHDKWGVPYANIALTPMIGGNDIIDEHFTLEDVDTLVAFALQRGLAGIHYWSYDRDTDCPRGAASPTCNSLGEAGTYAFLNRFLARGLR